MTLHHAPAVAFLVAAMFSGCQPAVSGGPRGHYTDGNFGVFVFRDDGVLGYTLATKVDFYDEDNLPPTRGRWQVTKGGEVKIRLDDKPSLPFRIEWQPATDSFDLIFDSPPERDFPPVMHFKKG